MGLGRDAQERPERPKAQVLDLHRREPVVARPEVGLQTVVGEELDELLGASPGCLLDPGRDRGMRARPLAPREALVGDLARQDVFEDELRLSGDRRREARQDQLALLQTVERRAQVLPVPVQQTSDGPRPEHATDDRRSLEGALLHGVQQVDPCREHCLHRVRDLHLRDRRRRAPPVCVPDDHALVDQVTDDLFEEEGVALGALEDPLTHGSRQIRHREQQPDEPVRFDGGERVEADRGDVALAAAPTGTPLGQLRARRTQEECRPDHAVGELLQEIEQRLVGPVDVVDHRDQRRPAREGREEGTPRPGGS